jgi:hypothetical protein
MKEITAAFSIYFCFIYCLAAQQNIKINEVLASNVLSCHDEQEEYDDWIEIYNPSVHDIDIAGYYMSDDPSNLRKWRVPYGLPDKTTVPAGGFIILWADAQPLQGPLHTNFKISSAGEVIFMIYSNGTTVIDDISIGVQYADISFGCYPDGTDNYGYIFKPSPGASNAACYPCIVQAPEFNPEPGFYSGSCDIEISSISPTDKIYYSLDGSDITEASMLYSTPLLVGRDTVLKAQVLQGDRASFPGSGTYFINNLHTIPVISVITDPDNLFGAENGIYSNPTREGRAWERRTDLEYFRDGDLKLDISCSIRIQGNTGREMDKKSFRLFFREGFGTEPLRYKFFDDTSVDSFRNIVLRAGYDDDLQNELGTLLRDPLCSKLWARLNRVSSHGSFAALYLNSDYWGLYNVREDINEHFFEDYTGYSDYDIIRLRWTTWELYYGNDKHWKALLDFFKNESLVSEENFSRAEQYIDIDNFTTLQALSHFTGYRSWTYGSFVYRENIEGSKWKWTVWDMDRAFVELSWNGFYYYDHPSSEYWINIINNKLLENNTYRHYFVNRCCDLMNTIFLPSLVSSILDSLVLTVYDEIPRECERWGTDFGTWLDNIDSVRYFIENRPSVVREQMEEWFGLSGPDTLYVDCEEGGKVRINSIEPATYPWKGLYYPEVPVEITAIPDEGYRFAGWTDQFLPYSPVINISINNTNSIKARFESTDSEDLEIITPREVPAGQYLPVVARARYASWDINTLMHDELVVSSPERAFDGNLKIKYGTGTALLEDIVESDTILYFNGSLISDTLGPMMVRDDYPVIGYSGSLPAGNIIWNSDTVRKITSDIIVPVGTKLSVTGGTWVVIGEKKNIIVYGEIEVLGTPEEPVVFTSSEPQQAWGGIEIRSDYSSFFYCFLVNGGGDDSKGWEHTGRQSSLFAYENSRLDLDNCYIMYTSGKAMGAIQSRININNCVTSFAFHGGEFHYCLLDIRNSYYMNLPNDDHIYIQDEDNDGFHIDYVYPYSDEYSVIDNCYFITTKDDGVDHHASRLHVKNCFITDCIHEGVAVSEEDTIKVTNTVITGCNQGIELGWSSASTQVYADHCVIVDNNVGLRVGDEYNREYEGNMKVTSTILYDNGDNIYNYIIRTGEPKEGAIDISFSMTNDGDYDGSPYCITGIPVFDDYYYLDAGSPGKGMGVNGSDMGLYDEGDIEIPDIVINEIMYSFNSDGGPADWLELLNNSMGAADLSGMKIRDENDDHEFTIPEGTLLPALGFIIICEDTALFKLAYPDVTRHTGNMGFGLASNDEVRLYDRNGHMVDDVDYDSQTPWPVIGDNEFYSIVLKNPNYDNSLPESWTKLSRPGNPQTYIKEPENSGPFTAPAGNVMQDLRIYPNPCPANNISISFNLLRNADITVSMFNILGEKIEIPLDNVHLGEGLQTLSVCLSGVPAGIYCMMIELRGSGFASQVYKAKIVMLRQ